MDIFMKDFLWGLTGRVVLPFDPLYTLKRQGFNRAIQKYPLVIVYCRNKKDVSNAVVWARKHSIPIRIRSGGHNYEGYSNGDYLLVIDISEMKGIEIVEDTKQLYIETGVTNKLVYEVAASKGYPFPGGTCPTVGVSGFALGGGWGLSCRYLGLGCDSLEEVELVNYEGDIITTNKRCNTDLFWALRGAGGGNFGVAVSMRFRLPKRIEKVTLIEIDYLHVDAAEQEEFLRVWQDWLKCADYRVTLIARIYNSKHDGLAMLVRGIFYGGTEEAKDIMAKFLVLKHAVYAFSYSTFLEAVTIIGSVYPPYEKFASVSRFVTRDFLQPEIGQVVGLIRKRPSGSVFTGLSLYALGGKVAAVRKDETAFFYRKAQYITWLETVWEEREYAAENEEWVRRRYPVLAQYTTGSYVNFPYRGLIDYLEAYYGSHMESLIKVKAKYDPFNVFTYPQGIIPTMGHDYPVPKEQSEPDIFLPASGDRDAMYRGFRYVTETSVK
ncbi:hypothetical protein acsn021_18650 [Anaerocolumna cellulosilytica]|uniref:FAD-binding PCMH-type domain-containing protein n=2 Tax=Anaerocolumna cellulosilytica TaxID=433286 RepID=A0A6S6QX45_9FIRM|nr:hypothetical protein acsn021_18650 [Anaerocolumna cellulosilytica]